MTKIAIIKTGGKQYKVKEKDILKIEKITGDVGSEVEFDKVLLIADGDEVEIGKPFLKDKKVKAKILEHGKNKKVLVVKYKPKTRYKRRRGHRQMFTGIQIQQISN